MECLIPILVFSILTAVIMRFGLVAVNPSERQWLARLLVVALVLRFACATIFATIPESRMFHEDADGYEMLGIKIAERWENGGSTIEFESGTPNRGWFYVSAAVYYIIGPYPAAVPFFNCFLGMITILFIYLLGRHLFHTAVARTATQLVALFPSIILWNSTALKDTFMTMAITISLYSCIRMKNKFSFFSLVGTVGPLLAMQPVRFYMVYFCSLAVVLSLTLDRGMKAAVGIYKQVIVGGGIVALLAFAGLSGKVQQDTSFLSLEKASAFRQGMSTTANSGFAATTDTSSPGAAIAYLPLGLTMLLFSPFPWQWTSIRALMAAPETVLFWIMCPALIRGIIFAARKRFPETSPLLIFTLTLTLAYSLVHGNVGSGFRQRAQIFVLLFLFCSLGIWMNRCKDRRIDPSLLLNKPNS